MAARERALFDHCFAWSTNCSREGAGVLVKEFLNEEEPGDVGGGVCCARHVDILFTGL